MKHSSQLSMPLINPRMNFRNHRKIVVIDGRIGYVGGFNVGDEYLGLNKKFGYWRDTHLRIEGSAVHPLQTRFILDWNQASEKNDIEYAERYFPSYPTKRFRRYANRFKWTRLGMGTD